jgi:hypothetical protein
MDLEMSRQYKDAIYNGNELYRNGYSRFNLPYFSSQPEVDYILDAIVFIGKYGWMFLPHYQFSIHTGIWSNRFEKEQNVRTWLGEVDYSSGEMAYHENSSFSLLPEETEHGFKEVL